MRARLIGAALAAVLLGAIGYGLLGRAHHEGAEPGAGPAVPAPVSVIRHGSEITVAGDVADPAARRALLDAVITSSEDVTVIDRLGVVPGAQTPEFAAAAPVFEAAAGLDDFTLLVSGDTVTLGGTAANQDESAAVQAAAEDAWPRAHVVNEVAVNS
ncbi:hypothetical protein [Mycolicibacter longobardus]|uniref:Peptidoglycan-binding protein ArfA BON-like domain-containing protein n=1 Tax=Mycolicibacter longobardus TaxID=1108812 RepID=A0A1X1YIB1_9MYCO|nr:hypothetical protein [Mycolicibacter longobardus]MCV7385897.1 hypothetical protein [Mycolicibacter longobardus]ORW10751.1 hypothetical protein AWC16_13535 [Mycolicibacter longobardus]